MERRCLTPIAILAMAVLAALMVGCQGPAGPQGPPGREGFVGEIAPPAIAEYVGAETCGNCHEENYEVFLKSGHAWKLNPVVDGQPPEYPFTEVLIPPDGYGWDDILYVIGGYNWKARFIDQDGFIITGDEDGTTQYNFPNAITGNSVKPLQNRCRLLRIPKSVLGISDNNYLLEPILTAFITLSLSYLMILSKPFL